MTVPRIFIVALAGIAIQVCLVLDISRIICSIVLNWQHYGLSRKWKFQTGFEPPQPWWRFHMFWEVHECWSEKLIMVTGIELLAFLESSRQDSIGHLATYTEAVSQFYELKILANFRTVRSQDHELSRWSSILVSVNWAVLYGWGMALHLYFG